MAGKIKSCNLIVSIIAMLCSYVPHAQRNTPTNSSTPAATLPVAPVPAAYRNDVKLNVVRKWQLKVPGVVASGVSSLPVEQASSTAAYVDGFGRTIQVVGRQSSPLKKDMVAAIVYDELGQQEYQYLPFTASSASPGNVDNDGQFKYDPFQQSVTFNGTVYPGESIFYSANTKEASPLKRNVKQSAPGNAWAGSGRGIMETYGVNVIADSVMAWKKNDAGLLSSDHFIPTGVLSKKRVTDEDGGVTEEFLNKDNQVILKRNRLSFNNTTGQTGWISTYFLYDLSDKLVAVIPPKAVEYAMSMTGTNKTISTTVAAELCFFYTYIDNKVIRKKIPGAGEVLYVYDNRGRLVMSQDSTQRFQGKWLVNKYDGLNRQVQTGIWTNNTSFSTHTTAAAGSSNYPETGSNYLLLVEYYYDNYDWAAGIAGINKALDASVINGSNFVMQYNQAPLYALPIEVGSERVREITGTKMNILGSQNYLYTLHIYDINKRLIQTQATNSKGGSDITTFQYDFSGKVLRTHLKHYKGTTNPQAHSLLTKAEFDHEGRLKKLTKRIDNGVEKDILIEEYAETANKKRSIYGNNLETIDYQYNIRGWLTGINDNYVRGTTTNNFFGQQINYDFGFSNTSFNGSISGQQWKSAGDGVRRAYGYWYDNTNRLTGADFSQQNSPGAGYTNDMVDFSVKHIAYDPNGNLLGMQQKGMKVAAIETIDALRYDYFANSNRLKAVKDTASDAASLLGDFKDGTNTGDDYTYDGNGNMTRDLNKSIVKGTYQGITYNYLNLPETIEVSGKGIITYTYDAQGKKIRKKVVDNTVNPAITTVTDFIAGFVYQNDTLQYIPTENGQIRRKDSSGVFVYDYFVTDHQGNVRVVLTEQTDTAMYAATMESNRLASENALFANVENTRFPVSSIAGYPNDNATTPNAYVSKLNGSDGQVKVGPAILLKVMAGDTVSIQAKYFYRQQGQNTSSNQQNLLSQLLTAFGGVSNGTVLGGKVTEGAVNGQVFNQQYLPQVITGLKNNGQNAADKPKAYLNMVLFDEQFNLVTENSLVRQVNVADALTAMTVPYQRLRKNGYLYVYLTNESPMNVYFDNLVVNHQSGPLMEETHYYPFGGTMAAISTKAALKKETPMKYNGKELQRKEFRDGGGLEWYEYGARNYDVQIGRFFTQDRFAEKAFAASPYSYAANNPVLFIDQNGDSVNVRNNPNDRKLFREGLESVFGEHAKHFGFTSTGNLIYTGNYKNMSPSEQALFLELSSLMNDKTEHTNIVYATDYNVPVNLGPGKITSVKVNPLSQGGEGTISKLNPGIDDNYIIIHPTVAADATVNEVKEPFYSWDPLGSKKLDGTMVSRAYVKVDPKNLLWHGIGHVLYQGQTQEKVIDIDNRSRRLNKVKNPDGTFTPSPLPERNYDMMHNRNRESR